MTFCLALTCRHVLCLVFTSESFSISSSFGFGGFGQAKFPTGFGRSLFGVIVPFDNFGTTAVLLVLVFG
jgi:hypothetical protein